MEKQSRKITPYRTSTGLEIGQFYERRQIIEPFHDMELLQEALLIDPTEMKKERARFIVYLAVVAAFAIFALTLQ